MSAWPYFDRLPFRVLSRLVLICGAIVALVVPLVAAQGAGGCPEPIASLLPREGAPCSGAYNAAGPMGIGSGAKKLRFQHPCVTDTEFPARLTIAVTYYGGESAELLQMQGDAADQQTLLNAEQSLGGHRSPVKKEDLAGGTIVYASWTSACPALGAGEGPDTRPPIPNVELKGVARTANARLEVSLEGRISLDRAKGLVAEVFENLKKTKFETGP
jgi:hypothetical protein